MNYSELSDFEINAMVEAYDKPSSPKNYCGLVEHAWPIITANKINIEWGENAATDLIGRVSANCWHIGDKVLAFDVDTNEHSPLRAAMVVYLMMQEQQYNAGATV